VVPLRRLTPIFTALIAAVALQESIGIYMGFGVLLATVGAFVVASRPSEILENGLTLGTSKKALLLALCSAVLYGFTSTADRAATQTIDPTTYTLILNGSVSIAYAAILARKPQRNLNALKSKFEEYGKIYLAWGILGSAASFSIFKAFSMAKAAQVTTVLQLQVLIPVLGGFLLFNEKGLIHKLFGSGLIIGGIILTAL
jgi:EamA-like transporter family.